ncbi:MAG TPA: hypothetical protein VM470_07400 [Acidimicrobiia bacterium]|nr:hypothetical protein [Acidimicrobiia bacterium]
MAVLILAGVGAALALADSYGPAVIATVIFVLATAIVGLLITVRVRGHPIGWLLLVAALAYTTGALAVTYGELTLERPGSLPFHPLSVWAGNAAFGLGAGISATYALLLFPTGRLPSRRWRPVAWGAGIGLAGLLAGVTLSPSSFEGMPMANPLALNDAEILLLVLEGGGFYLFLAAVLASAASLVFRYRHARGDERQQLKWVALSVVFVAAGLVGPALWELVNGADQVSNDLENTIVSISLALVPVAIGIAILRYRLYDIDRVVSRTVSYVLVTAILLAFYTALVFVLTDLVPVEGDLAVVGATLGVAALFNPVRLRTQAVVDRRFNRSRYDSQRIIEEFSRRLPSQVDLSELTREVRAVVGSTMQPTCIAVWLRGEASS